MYVISFIALFAGLMVAAPVAVLSAGGFMSERVGRSASNWCLLLLTLMCVLVLCISYEIALGMGWLAMCVPASIKREFPDFDAEDWTELQDLEEDYLKASCMFQEEESMKAASLKMRRLMP